MNQMDIETVKTLFYQQKMAYSPSTPPSYETRMDRLSRIEDLCKNHIAEITEALQTDFGSRDPDLIFLADIFSPLSHAKYVKRHLKKWMKKEKTSSGVLALTGQRSYIVHEPLGVVGIMSPFNAPVSLALDPAIDALAAGNRVILKLSESTPQTATLIKSLVTEYFQAEELTVYLSLSERSPIIRSPVFCLKTLHRF